MAAEGTWDRVLARQTAAADEAGALDWTVLVDSTMARAHQHATSVSRHTGAGSNDTNPQTQPSQPQTLPDRAGREPADHALGRSRGGLSTKIHQLVDGHGLPLVLLSPGQAGDSPMFLPLLQQLKVGRPVGRPRTRPDGLCGDKAYSSRAIRKHLRGRRITTHIPESVDQKGQRQRRGSAGGRPPNFDPGAYRGRNVVECRHCHIKQWRGIATRYDKHALTYRAAVVLNAVIAWTRHLSDMP